MRESGWLGINGKGVERIERIAADIHHHGELAPTLTNQLMRQERTHSLFLLRIQLDNNIQD